MIGIDAADATAVADVAAAHAAAATAVADNPIPGVTSVVAALLCFAIATRAAIAVVSFAFGIDCVAHQGHFVAAPVAGMIALP